MLPTRGLESEFAKDFEQKYLCLARVALRMPIALRLEIEEYMKRKSCSSITAFMIEAIEEKLKAKE